MMTRSASRGSGVPGWTMVSVTPGSSSEDRDRRNWRCAAGAARRCGSGPCRSGGLVERHRILGGQPPRVGEMRDDAEAGPAGARLDEGRRLQKTASGSPWKLLMMNPLIRCASSALEDRLGPDERGDDAAAMDVADEEDRNVRRLRKAHIGKIAVAQIDLGRAAGAFDDDEVGFARERSESFRGWLAYTCRASLKKSRARERSPCGVPARSPARRWSSRA